MILQRECICIDFNANYNTLYKYYSISKQNCHFIQACSGFHFTLQNIIICIFVSMPISAPYLIDGECGQSSHAQCVKH